AGPLSTTLGQLKVEEFYRIVNGDVHTSSPSSSVARLPDRAAFFARQPEEPLPQSSSKKSVNKGGNGRKLRDDNQYPHDQQYHNRGGEPEFLLRFHEPP